MVCNLIKRVVLILFIPLFLFASQNISWIEAKPRSVAKDFYIYRYITEHNVSSKVATKLFYQLSRVNLRLFHLFAKKMDNKEFKKVSKCLKLPTSKLLKEDLECINIGLSLYDAFLLDNNTLLQLSKKLSKENPKFSHTLEILAKPDRYEYMLKNDKNLFLKIFNNIGSKNRLDYFNKEISNKDILQLSKLKDFNKAVKYIMIEEKLNLLKKSLLYIKPTEEMNHKTLFLLALNALQLKDKKGALEFLEASNKKAYYRFDKDKTLFWSYLISQEKSYLQKLSESFDINIYTIYAHEELQTGFNNIIIPEIKKIKKDYDIKDPFKWYHLLLKIKDKNTTQLHKIAQNFKYKNTIGQYSFIKERADGYKNSYYPFAFWDLLKEYDNKREALILAIARQESRFIPASISTSYALGMMQFMPFLAKATAKKLKLKKFDLDDMFDPKIAYRFANDHLDYLEGRLQHPLFIAYAYNGGIGFTRRMLKTNLFKKGEYEPYMSMELVPYSESRRYAKKVLANYIIYMQLLGEKVSFQSLMEKLK